MSGAYYGWDAPVLLCSNTDKQNAKAVLKSLPEHISNSISVQVNTGPSSKCTVLSVYLVNGVLNVDIEV